MGASVIDILEQLESTSGRLDKEEIMDTHSDNELLKRIFVAACDPYVDYGVRKFKRPDTIETQLTDDDTTMGAFVDRLLPDLATRTLTGNEAKATVTAAFGLMDERQQKWAERVLLKNLRCGVSDSIVEKTWPGLIKKFAVQLAETVESRFEDGKLVLDEVSYPVYVDPKLDGLRLIAIKVNGETTLYTRNGTVLTTLPKIKAALDALKADNIVFDGEGMAKDWNESASVMMARKTHKDDSTMTYNVFDCMPYADWASQSCQLTYDARRKMAEKILSGQPKESPLRMVQFLIAHNDQEVQDAYEEWLDEGYEGVMLKDLNALYKFKRSKGVLKLKPVTTHEGIIVDHYEGNLGTKREGLFGGFVVLLPNGVTTRVGGGFSDKLKADIQLEGPDSYLGRIAECECQPPLTEDGRMRFPVFLRFRDSSDVDPKLFEGFDRYQKSFSI
jgi:ATP-dependent DNA ligase